MLSFEHVIAPLIPVNLKAGFAATRFLLASERLCGFKCAPVCKCEVDTTTGPDIAPDKVLTREQELVAQLPALTLQVRDAINTIAAAGYVTLGRTIKQHWDNLLNTDPNSRPSQDQWDMSRLEAKRYLFRRFVMDGPATRFWTAAKVFAASIRDESAAKKVIAARKILGHRRVEHHRDLPDAAGAGGRRDCLDDRVRLAAGRARPDQQRTGL